MNHRRRGVTRHQPATFRPAQGPRIIPRLDDFFRQSASRAELARLGNFNAIRLSCAERMANGKALRRNVPRSSHAEFRSARDRLDPVTVLERQNASRIKELVPVRMARMLTSPFAFFRGSAAIMAGDLANSPRTDLEVMACGDMHLMNFGLFASAERNLIFAINDFDEVLPGPNGTSNGWRQALRLPRSFSTATGAMRSRLRTRLSKHMSDGCAGMPRWDSWRC